MRMVSEINAAKLHYDFEILYHILLCFDSKNLPFPHKTSGNIFQIFYKEKKQGLLRKPEGVPLAFSEKI